MSHQDVFCKLPIKFMWPFKDATALDKSVFFCIASDEDTLDYLRRDALPEQ